MPAYLVVEVNEGLARLAGDLAERQVLRGFDALHLASALELRGWIASRVKLVAFGERLLAAAGAEGLAI